MSAHSNASYESATLCDDLFEELSEIIPNLQRNPTKGSCGLWQTGRTRFAYVYHSKSMSQIEIWCRGDMDELLRDDPGLDVQGRDNPKQVRVKTHFEGSGYTLNEGSVLATRDQLLP